MHPPFHAAPSIRRATASLKPPCRAALLGAVTLALAGLVRAAAPQAAAEVLCSMRTGDATSTLRLTPGTDALASSGVAVGDHFELRGLALRDPADETAVGHIVVSVLDRASPGRPVILSQSRWSAEGHELLGPQAPWRPTLSGWQRVYSPQLGRELAWGCALVQAGASPVGWERADATLADAPSRRPPPATPRRVGARSTVTLAWLGDVMLADGPGRLIARGQDPFEFVAATLAGADLRIANLECVIATGGRRVAGKPWTFRAHPRSLDVLRRHVDAVSLANNHSGDFGPAAFAQMLGRLERGRMPFFGGGADLRAAHSPVIIERKGIRIALLGFNEMFPRQFEATPAGPGIAWADEEQIVADIRAARQRADVVIPFMHWGQEHSETAHARQRALARLMIDAGADAVVGAHPHLRQDVELIEGKPVIYSLGNFVFDGFSDADNNTGSILWMTVTSAGVLDWRLEPVHIDRAGRPHAGPRLLATRTTMPE